jgi:hypothetical protein
MGSRNRYHIGTATGPHWLTIPISGGREQRTPLDMIAIDHRTPWQRTHWRTVTSCYKRAPYFEHYEPLLSPLFSKDYNLLIDFCRDSLSVTSRLLQITLPVQELGAIQMPGFDIIDRRDHLLQSHTADPPTYLQVFQDRTGFLPNLSILDLILCEGPFAARVLQQKK